MQGISYARSRSALMQPETKYFDTVQSFAVGGAGDWTGTEVTCASYIQSDGVTVGAYTDSALLPSAIGTSYGQVTGNKYMVKQLRIKGEISAAAISDAADMAANQTVRIVLVHDTQPNGAQAQGEEVFTDTGSARACNYSFLAMGAGSGGRFRILKDKTYIMNMSAAGTDGTNTNSLGYNGHLFRFSYKPKKPLQVVLKANSGVPTVASLSNNNIFMLAHMGSAAPVVTLNSVCRCYYVD